MTYTQCIALIILAGGKCHTSNSRRSYTTTITLETKTNYLSLYVKPNKTITAFKYPKTDTNSSKHIMEYKDIMDFINENK